MGTVSIEDIAPEAVASAILHASETPVRDVFVGGGARAMAAAGHMAPGLTDRMMEAAITPGTPSGRLPQRPREANGLDNPTESLTERGNYEGHVMKSSLYTQAVLHPVLADAAILGVGWALLSSLRAAPHRPARIGGSKGRMTEKALHIRLEAKPGREAAVEKLLDIRSSVERELATRPWFGTRLSRSVFEIFETFPNEAGRKAHLSGKVAAILMQRSNALLARPAEINKLDVLATKPG